MLFTPYLQGPQGPEGLSDLPRVAGGHGTELTGSLGWATSCCLLSAQCSMAVSGGASPEALPRT